jgi:hypothetical protein
MQSLRTFGLFSVLNAAINIYREPRTPMTSQINPNNINGGYPVAGQPNNTQGFRDNFTNTRTNFEIAASEITALQTRSVLKSALPGATLDNNMNDQELYAVRLRDVSYTYLAVPATAGAITVDYSASLFQLITPTANVSLAITNWPVSGTAGSIRISFKITDASYTVTLPPSVNVGIFGLQGISPGVAGESNTINFGRTGTFAFEFVSVDGGQNIEIFDESRPKDVFTDRVLIIDDTVTTSTTTGALIVGGGVGVAGNLHVGGAIVGDIQVSGVTVAGNVVGGNINTGGQVVATGNITGGNITTGGRISATGNIVGGNVLAGQLSLSGNVINSLNVTGNITGGNVRSTGIVSASGNITGANISAAGQISVSGTVISANIATAGFVRSSSPVAGVGYSTGSGGAVTQGSGSGKATAVTLNTATGEITMDSAQLNGDTTVSFVMTNSAVANTDVMIVNQVGGGNIGVYSFNAQCNSGNALISVHNMTNTNRSDAIVLRYAVIKGAVA